MIVCFLELIKYKLLFKEYYKYLISQEKYKEYLKQQEKLTTHHYFVLEENYFKLFIIIYNK